MKPLHYLIFHPDSGRKKTEVQGKALIECQLENWEGNIWVDSPGGNEDPFVFSQQWLYSYCHATQLKRKPSLYPYVTEGSYLFFCSGDAADKGFIELDTVFVVDHVATWPHNKEGIPEEFKNDYNNSKSDQWERHFKYGLNGGHTGKYTYVSRHWCNEKDDYSFLPISHRLERVKFCLNDLTPKLKFNIEKNRVGKIPLILSHEQKAELLKKILSETSIQVIGDLKRENETNNIIGSCNIVIANKNII